ncbi:unnamed protein product [Camellia sinensis]
MQTTELPQSVCKYLDRLNINFIWGDLPGKRKVHLVNWKQVCKSKQEGGLGIKRAEDHNLALLTKLGWKLISDKDTQWSAVLRGKYLHKESLMDWPSNRLASHTWRSIIKTRDLLKKCVKWPIGNGQNISFWNDWWYGETTIASQCPGDHTSNYLKVTEVIKEYGPWNLDSLTEFIPQSILLDISQIHLPQFVEVPDSPHWIGAPSGNFTVSATYDLLTTLDQDSDNVSWHWIWKQKIPQNLKGLCWLLFHEKILTNYYRKIGGLTTDDSCPRCNLAQEDLCHLFKDCPKSMEE